MPSKDMGLNHTSPGPSTHLQCLPHPTMGWKGPKLMREAEDCILASIRLMLRREGRDLEDPWVLPGC